MAKPTDGKELITFQGKKLEEMQKIGMKKVDPADIRPPTIRLIQKSSDTSLFFNTEGKAPSVGQYFNTGNLEISDSFEAYILIAIKGEFTDRRKDPPEVKPQYTVLGVLAKDLSLFGITLKSSSFYALGPLFSATYSLKRPMFSIKVLFETKKLSGDKGEWYIPTCRIVGPEKDNDLLQFLYTKAKALDDRTEEVTVPVEEPEEEKPSSTEPI